MARFGRNTWNRVSSWGRNTWSRFGRRDRELEREEEEEEEELRTRRRGYGGRAQGRPFRPNYERQSFRESHSFRGGFESNRPMRTRY